MPGSTRHPSRREAIAFAAATCLRVGTAWGRGGRSPVTLAGGYPGTPASLRQHLGRYSASGATANGPAPGHPDPAGTRAPKLLARLSENWRTRTASPFRASDSSKSRTLPKKPWVTCLTSCARSDPRGSRVGCGGEVLDKKTCRRGFIPSRRSISPARRVGVRLFWSPRSGCFLRAPQAAPTRRHVAATNAMASRLHGSPVKPRMTSQGSSPA
jgi:hypothetical protein